MKPKVIVQNLGKIAYKEAWDYQQELMTKAKDIKQHNRKAEHEKDKKVQKHHFLFCEHPPVYTLGKSGSFDNLLLNEEQLAAQGFTFYKINRGGDITYHGPGQIVGYPILDLEFFFTDIHKYIRQIEEAIILTLSDYGIQSGRIEGLSGVWLEGTDTKPKRKICAIGVHLSRWVTMHGFAFNVNTNLQHFENIIPCGIVDKDKGVTSMQAELGYELDYEEVRLKVLTHFANLFEFEVFSETK